MKLTKRTEEQIKHSIDIEKDYTGGYNFISWLVFMRTFFTFSAIPLALIILGATIYFQSVISIVIVSSLIICWYFLIKKEYKELKKGISS